jgi:hypothetical protein
MCTVSIQRTYCWCVCVCVACLSVSCSSFHWFAVAVLAYNTTTVFAILPINFLTGLVIPYTRALLSNSVPPDEQAQMFAGLSGIESIGTLLSPLFSLGYSLTVSSYGEAMFLLMSALTGCSALILFHIRTQKLISSEQYGSSASSSFSESDDMKEPILGSQPLNTRRSPSTGAHSRAHSIASNATYGDQHTVSMSVSMAF